MDISLESSVTRTLFDYQMPWNKFHFGQLLIRTGVLYYRTVRIAPFENNMEWHLFVVDEIIAIVKSSP